MIYVCRKLLNCMEHITCIALSNAITFAPKIKYNLALLETECHTFNIIKQFLYRNNHNYIDTHIQFILKDHVIIVSFGIS